MTRTKSRRRSSTPRSVRRTRRTVSSSGFLGLPTWATLSLGILGTCGLVYGLMQIEMVNDFMDPVIHDVGEFFGLAEDEGIDTRNLTHDRTYSTYSGIGS